jgi:hypothetical protein
MRNEIKIATLAFLGALVVGGATYELTTSREQKDANTAARKIGEAIKTSEGPNSRNIEEGTKRAAAVAKATDLSVKIPDDPRVDETATPQQKAALKDSVNQKMAAVKADKLAMPVAIEPQRRRIESGDDCDIFAVSRDGEKFEELEVVCSGTKITGPRVTAEIIGATSRENSSIVFVGTTISPDFHRVTIPLSPENMGIVRRADRINIPTQNGGGLTPIYAAAKNIMAGSPKTAR